ncbi:hypothetical protein ACU8KH_05474 [Lachancea thermotolerans]
MEKDQQVGKLADGENIPPNISNNKSKAASVFKFTDNRPGAFYQNNIKLLLAAGTKTLLTSCFSQLLGEQKRLPLGITFWDVFTSLNLALSAVASKLLMLTPAELKIFERYLYIKFLNIV